MSSVFLSRVVKELAPARSSAWKLARLLLSRFEDEHGASITNAPRLPTHEQIAQRIGTSRPRVSRLINEFSKGGLIGVDNASIVIRDRAKLEAIEV